MRKPTCTHKYKDLAIETSVICNACNEVLIIRGETNKIMERITKIIKQEKVILLEDILKNSSGGGNWRRIINQKLAGIKKEL